VKTRDLNDWLQLAMQRHPPPSVNGKRIKPKYMAQTKARPPTFVLFSSRADQMPEQYRRYLVNSLRESFDLPGVPLRITIKSGKNPYAEGEEKYGGSGHAKSGSKGGFRSAERGYKPPKKEPGKRPFGKAPIEGGTGSTKSPVSKPSQPTKPKSAAKSGKPAASAFKPIVRPRSAPRRRPAKP
jgi:GTP-binding protein